MFQKFNTVLNILIIRNDLRRLKTSYEILIYKISLANKYIICTLHN